MRTDHITLPARLERVLLAAQVRGIQTDPAVLDRLYNADDATPVVKSCVRLVREASDADAVAHDGLHVLSGRTHRLCGAPGHIRLEASAAALGEAFVARPGQTLLSVSVTSSDVEALAVLSGDPVLLAAVATGNWAQALADEIAPLLPTATAASVRSTLLAMVFGARTEQDEPLREALALALARTHAWVALLREGDPHLFEVHRLTAQAANETLIAVAQQLAFLRVMPVLLADMNTLLFETPTEHLDEVLGHLHQFVAPATCGLRPRISVRHGDTVAALR